MRITLNHIHRSGTIESPLYAKISDNKYIKVIHDNEFFGSDELERFKKKNIHYLYIEKEKARSFFKKQTLAYESEIKNKTLSLEEQLDISLEISTSIQDMSASFGFTEDLEKITKTGIDLALKTMLSNPSLKSLLGNLNLQTGNYLAIHSSRLPYLANHISKMMGWGSDTTAYKMALASFIHDSTLHNPIHAKYQNESELVQHSTETLSKEELENFINHPIKAAEIASQFKGVPSDVDIIIAQHHENCAGTGFPFKINHSLIAPLSCVFIVAHELLCYIEEKGDEFKIDDFIKEKEEKYFAGNFKKILIELALLKLE